MNICVICSLLVGASPDRKTWGYELETSKWIHYHCAKRAGEYAGIIQQAADFSSLRRRIDTVTKQLKDIKDEAIAVHDKSEIDIYQHANELEKTIAQITVPFMRKNEELETDNANLARELRDTYAGLMNVIREIEDHKPSRGIMKRWLVNLKFHALKRLGEIPQ